MESLFTFLAERPVLLVVLLVLLAFLVFAALKKLAQLAVVAALLLVGYVAYMAYLSADTRQAIEEKAGKVLGAGEKAASEIPLSK
jgi:Ca2+/Na+ antiporter